MIKDPPEQTLNALVSLASHLGATSFHTTPIRVCDNCKDESKEAFPYGVKDRDGQHWDDLCNDCFETLGCAYPAEDEATGQIYDLFDEITEEYQLAQMQRIVNDQDEFNRRLSQQVAGWRLRLEELLAGTVPEAVEKK